MRDSWSEEGAREAVARWDGCGRDLALRTYASRLIGSELELVLHGGGNTSVKTTRVDALGDPVEVLCVKGSGSNLASVEPAGHPA
ncbi:MAG: hypothetical protein H0V89_07120 [Deltaproteobacteria bacterium]|nr:hypothetical protein [Deltaproteobacteria bacterium]